MDKKTALSYYSRPEIQKAILNFAKTREIAVRFEDFFGKRPDVIEYLNDIKKFVDKGVLSFHCSEERWTNPLILGPTISKRDLENNRAGWDLILDLDGVDFIYAKLVAKIILDYLKDLGIKNISTKFSGNKGFHLGIPFEAFSSEIVGFGPTRLLFPQAPQKIAMFLMQELKGKISKAILDLDKSVENIAKKYNLEVKDLIIEDEESYNLNYIKLIEIDTILITSRHLFRMPYSLHEKSGYVSIPVKNELIEDFERFLGDPKKVEPSKYTNFEFLNYNSSYGKDANILLMKAYEQINDEEIFKETIKKHNLTRREHKGAQNSQFSGPTFLTENIVFTDFDIEGEVDLKDFPKTIHYILNNKFEDGKKRALFVLLTFLYGIKWDKKVIENMLLEWNSKNQEPLKNNYMKAQLFWFNSQERTISTPNFDTENYYKQIGISEEIINKDKNKFTIKSKSPLHYIFILLKAKDLKKNLNKDKKTSEKKKVETK